MPSSDVEDVAANENGEEVGMKRRTRSGRNAGRATTTVSPKAKKTRKNSQKVIAEEIEEMNELSKGLDKFLEQEMPEDFEMPAEADMAQPLKEDTNNDHLSRALMEDGNESMDGVMKTCIQDTMLSGDGGYFDPSDSDLLFNDVKVPMIDDTDIVMKEMSDVEEIKETEVICEAVKESESAEEEEEEEEEESEQPSKEPEEPEEQEEPEEKSAPTENEDSTEDIRKSKDTEGIDEETEVVSEDELPTVEKPEVKDAENVSDDELPGPKFADLPADTEVVSEDELPSSKKESSRKRKADTSESGYDPGSPTSESESSTKKAAISKDGEAKPQPSEKKSSEEKSAKKKVLPELDKYWKAVNDDATDFTGWTYLLQYVDQENDVEAAREAYDAFLSRYPYCYGYWRKYADYEKKKGSKKKCLEVLERGLRGIPLSVDLWIHYLNHIKATRTEEPDFIRQQYDRAISACGLEFRSDRLWDSYIKWEGENGTPLAVTQLFDRLLATPTLSYTQHFESFQEHIMSNPIQSTISTAEFIQLRKEVRADTTKAEEPTEVDPDVPPGEEEADDHVRTEAEGVAIKERVISIRRKVHKQTTDQVAQRWNYEEGIKRPYFHVKPLERCQLKNWKAYLNWEQERNDHVRTVVLYERCLIACALYEEFWIKMYNYLEERISGAEDDAERQVLVTQTRDVLERACTIHHTEKPVIHSLWAGFEEQQGAHSKAADILEKLDKACPNLIQVACRRINLERRRGNLEKVCQLYESYIAQMKNKVATSSMSIRYARFLLLVKRDAEAAIALLKTQIAKDPTCQRLYMQLLDIALNQPSYDLKVIIGYLDDYINMEGVETESKLLFMQRKAELLEELSDNVRESQAALVEYQRHSKSFHKKKNKDKGSSDSSKKKGDSGAAPPLPPQGSGAAPSYNGAPPNYNTTYNASSYPPPTQAQGYEGNTAGYPQQPYHQWGPTPYQQPPYQHHGWTPYPNYY